MPNKNTSSFDAKNSNVVTSNTKITKNDVLVGIGIIGLIMMPAVVETLGHPFVYLAAMAGFIYAGKGFDFQNKSNR